MSWSGGSSDSSTPDDFELKDCFEIALKRFPESQMAKLISQRRDGKFCDATIICSDGELKAHRCIIATLCSRDLSEPVNLPLKVDAVKRLIHFCYTGYLKVTVETLEQVIGAGEALQCDFLLNSTAKWVTRNVRQIANSERVLKDLDFDIVRRCVGQLKHMNEVWQDFLTLWAGSDTVRKKDVSSLQSKLEKYAFVSIYRYAAVGGKVMRFDGSNVIEEDWQVPQKGRVLIIDSKTKKRVDVARNGKMSLFVGNKLKMTHSKRAIGVQESVRPIVLWLNDGSLLKLVDKQDPFEELGSEEKAIYQGAVWKKAPIGSACADLYVIPEHGAVLHYPGHGTCFVSRRGTSGFQAWNSMPCSDVHYAYSDGRRFLLVSRDVNVYTLVNGETFQNHGAVIQGTPQQSPFVIPSFCLQNRLVFALVDLEKSPKTLYFVQFEGGQIRVISESFDAIPEAQFSVM